MSRTIDEQVVQMSFDNSKFESGVTTSLKTIEHLKSSLDFEDAGKGFDKFIKGVDFNPIGKGADFAMGKFIMLQNTVGEALKRITNKVLDTGQALAKAITIQPMIDGLREYEMQMDSVQTILSNTKSKGSTIEDVNAALDELNVYADKTIYNFTQMTANIGRFTAAGVGLKESTSAIKGIANLAAVSGSSATQASTAMYQLSQALASGVVKLQDWNSVVNANMGGEVFQEALKRTSRVLGTGVDEAIKKAGTFRDSLTKGGWLTKEVLTETLAQLAGEYDEAALRAQGYNEEQIKQILDLAQTAEDAATKVKTFHQLIDTLKEAMGSGWAMTFRTIVGDFLEARELWTKVNNVLSDMINQNSDARNALIKEWVDFGGRASAIITVKSAFESLMSVLKAVGHAFQVVFPPITAKNLLSITSSFRELVKSLKPSEDLLWGIRGVAEGLFATLKLAGQGLKFTFDSLGKFLSGIIGITGIDKTIASIGEFLARVGYLIRYISEAGVGAGIVKKQFQELLMMFPPFAVAVDVATAAFSVLRLAFTAVTTAASAVWDALSPLVNTLGVIFSQLFGDFNNFGEGSGFHAFLESIRNTCDGLTATLKGTEETVDGFSTGVNKKFGGVLEFIKAIMKAVAATLDGIMKIASKVVGKVKEVLNGVIDAFASTFQKFGIDVNNIISGGMGLTGVIAALVTAFMTIISMRKPVMDIVGILRDVKDQLFGSGSLFSNLVQAKNAGISALHSLEKALEEYQRGIQVGMIKQIAIAVAILAGSLIALSLVKPDKLAVGIGGLTAVMTLMVSAFWGMQEIVSTYDKIGTKRFAGMTASMLMLSVAFGTLAISLRLLATADPLKLAVATAALVVSMGALTGVFAAMQTIMSKYNVGAKKFAATAVTLVIFSGAILTLAVAMRLLATADPVRLAAALGALVVSMFSLVAVLKLMQKWNVASISPTIEYLMGFAIAMLLLSAAVRLLASLSMDELENGLIGVGALLVGVAVFAKAIDGAKLGGKTALSIALVAASLLILQQAVKGFAEMDGAKMLQGLAGIYGAVGALLVFNTYLKDRGKGGIAAALAINFATKSIMKLAEALKMFVSLMGEGTKEDMIKLAGGIVAMVASVALLTGSLAALGAVGPEVMAGGAALLIASAAMMVLAKALQEMSTIGNIGDTLITFGVALTALALGMLAMNGSIAGAGALAIAAAGLALLAPALLLFSQINLAAAAGGLLVVMVALAAFAGIAVLVTPILPVLAGLAAVMVAIGIAAVAIGASLAAVAGAFLLVQMVLTQFASMGVETVGKALQAIGSLIAGIMILVTNLASQFATMVITVLNSLTAIMPALGMFLTTLGMTLLTTINTLLPKLFTVINNFVTRLMQLVIDKIPQFAQMVGDLISAILALLSAKIPELLDMLDVVSSALLDFLEKKIPEYVNTVLNIITAILMALNMKLPLILQLGTTLVVNFINGIGAAIPQVIQAGFNLAMSFMNGIGDKFRENGPAVGEAARNMFGGIIEGIVSAVIPGGEKIMAEFKNAIKKVLEMLKGFVKDFKEMGSLFVDGLVSGLKKVGDKVKGAASDLGNAVKKATGKALEEKSPSKAAEQQGLYYGEGLEHGINKKAKDVENAAFKMGRGTIDAMNKALDEHSESKEGIQSGEYLDEGVETGIDNEADKPAKAAGNMAKGVADTVKDGLSGVGDTVKEEIKHVYHGSYTLEELNAKKAQKTEESNDAIAESNNELVQNEQDTAASTSKTKKESLASDSSFWSSLLENRKKGVDGLKYQDTQLAEFEKDILKKTSDIIDEYKTKINENAREMADKDIFKKVSDKTETSAQELMDNLKGQINEIEEFTNVMNSLNSRISNTALKDAINEMGVESLGELEALNSMTDDQLTEYTKLYDEKYSASLKQLKTKAQNELSSLYGGVSIDIDAFAATFDGSLTSIENYFKSPTVQDKAQKAGVNITEGIGEGMANKDALEAIDKGSKDVEKHTDKKALPEAFDSHSPAKKTIPQGVNVTRGIAKGMTESSAKSALNTACVALMNYLVKALDKAYTSSNVRSKALSIGKSIGENIAKGAKKASSAESGSKSAKEYTDGVVSGLKTMGSAVESASSSVSEDAVNSFKDTFSLLSDMEDFDASPVIAPVMDLSDVQNGLYSMNDLFSNNDTYSIAADVSSGLEARRMARLAEQMSMQNAMNSIYDSNTTRSNELADLKDTVGKLNETVAEMKPGESTTISPTFNIQSNDPRAVANEVNRSLQRMIDRHSAVWA